MDCEVWEGGAICGNFAELSDSKPEPFDYDKTSKWHEPYSFEWRETLGKTICNCKTVRVHYAPYYGYDYFHSDSCNLIRKLEAEPQIQNLYETYLPAINRYNDSVPNTNRIPLYIKTSSRVSRIKVRVGTSINERQMVLV